MIPIAGSAYTYAYATMGELLAWIIGWDLVLEYAVGAATVSVSWSSYVVKLLHTFGIELPPSLVNWPMGHDSGHHQSAGGVHHLRGFDAADDRHLGIGAGERRHRGDEGHRSSIIVICVGYAYIKPENYVPFIPPNTGVFGEFGWSGIFRARGRNLLRVHRIRRGFDRRAGSQASRKRDMPIGIIGSLVVCTILYVLFAHVLTGMVNYKTFNGDASPVATVITCSPATRCRSRS